MNELTAERKLKEAIAARLGDARPDIWDLDRQQIVLERPLVVALMEFFHFLRTAENVACIEAALEASYEGALSVLKHQTNHSQLP